MPSLLCGAAYGRIVGQLCSDIPAFTETVDPGIFALIGAASVLGGMIRMVISLTVILLEATGNVK